MRDKGNSIHTLLLIGHDEGLARNVPPQILEPSHGKEEKEKSMNLLDLTLASNVCNESF